VKRFFDEEKEIKPKVHEGEQLNTSITFNNKLFLKVYRRVDPGINPDAEISHFLSENCRFKHTPPFLSVLDWKLDNETITIAMLEVMIENHGNGESFMMERINNYIERILARDRSTISAYPRLGSFISPIGFEELNDEMKEFLSGSAGELARLIGERTAQLHQALTDRTSRDFQPEPFSLHYQRSLFAGMQSIVRETFDTLAKRKHYLPSLARKQADYISTKKQEISDLLKRIYQKKFDVLKTRIHGLYGLEEVLLTGKDVMLHNFNGNPLRSFSERRLRRSPLRDVAAMVRSFYYVAYKGFSSNTQIRKEELPELLPYADFWAYYMSSFFLKAYMDKLGDNEFIPKDPEDATVMIETYLIENALHYLNFDLKYRPENAIAPLMMIETILQGNIVTA
jgi:maltose alpha-D-glucosyltransferase/alpha-amylase